MAERPIALNFIQPPTQSPGMKPFAQGFDLARGIRMAGREDEVLNARREAGRQAAGGDITGGANTALAGGDTEMATFLQKQMAAKDAQSQAKEARFMNLWGAISESARTPEEYEQLKAQYLVPEFGQDPQFQDDLGTATWNNRELGIRMRRALTSIAGKKGEPLEKTVDPATGNVVYTPRSQAAGMRAPDTGEPLVQTTGPDGKPIYTRRSEAAGQQVPEKPEDAAKAVKIESDLRKEFTQIVKPFREVRNAYARIQASSENPSAAGDLSMIFNFMKMLDPGSVVRESEFATAAGAASVPEQFKGAYQRAVSGKKLSDVQRQDFIDRSQKLFEAQKLKFEAERAQYDAIANAYGAEPSRVTFDLEAGSGSGRGGESTGDPEIDDIINQFGLE